MPDHDGPSRTFALIPALICVLAVLLLDVPYFSLEPGPADPVEPLISIEGAETHPSEGSFLLTTVRLYDLECGPDNAFGRCGIAGYLWAWLDDDVELVRRQVIVPPGTSEEEVDQINTEQMRQSQALAAAAALRYLDYPVDLSGVGVLVSEVMEGLPADGALRPGDVIVGAAGSPVCGIEDLVGRIHAQGIGGRLDLSVRRDGGTEQVTLETVPDPEVPERPIVGIQIEPAPGDIELPLDVEIDAGEIGGPSAGLMFALGVVNSLTEPDLTRGRTIAGTGVISCGGLVGLVGGIRQKVAGAEGEGAEVFIVPADELEDACDAADEMLVVGVETLDEAVLALGDEAAARERSCGSARRAMRG